jgi:hypothetical protein
MQYINNLPNINETFIIEPVENTGQTETISACTAVYTNLLINCDSNIEINLSTNEININADLNPNIDATINLGTPIRRFRQINTVSGTSTYWNSISATIDNLSVSTIDLGYDSGGDHRILNADTSILNLDTLEAGKY